GVSGKDCVLDDTVLDDTVHPSPGDGLLLLDEQVIPRSDRDPAGGDVDVDDVAGRPTARAAEALALSDRDELDRGDFPEAATTGVDDGGGMQRPARADERRAAVLRRDEADVLA